MPQGSSFLKNVSIKSDKQSWIFVAKILNENSKENQIKFKVFDGIDPSHWYEKQKSQNSGKTLPIYI